MKFYGNIEKTFKDDQGFLIVCGHASTEALDNQGEIVKASAMAAALSDYMKIGNVREMHQPSAVGKTLLAEQDGKGTYIEVKVVDPVASMKCEEGVYTGFSIGGKATGRDPLAKNTITGLRLTEISLVDRPANPEATFTLFKLDDELGEEETEKADTKPYGNVAYADPKNGKYPIDTVEHIRAAWSYINMPKNAAKEKNVAEIKSRIIAAWKKKIDPKGPPSAEKGDTAMDIKKGMAHVAELAMILKELGYMVDDQADESQREGDNSPIPAKLEGWLKAGAGILKEMTQEELDELVAAAGQNLVPDATADAPNEVMMAEPVGEVQKVGAVFSQANRDKMKNLIDGFITIHNTLKENIDQFNSLLFPDVTQTLEPQQANMVANPNVYAQPEGERGTAGTPMGYVDTSINSVTAEPLAPSAVAGVHGLNSGNKGGDNAERKGQSAVNTKAEEPEDLKKSHDESLAKVASLTSEVEKLTSDKEALAKRVAELEAEPAAPKVKLLSLDKAQDAVVAKSAKEAEIEKLFTSKDPVDIAKAVHMRGARKGFPL